MQYTEHQIHSAALNRDFTYLTFGHGGRPMLVFPTQNGSCHDYNNFHMPESIADYINDGKVTLYCVGSIDTETWSDEHSHKGDRAWRQELWFRHITTEFIPQMMRDNGTGLLPIVTGNSMGATHSLNTFLRRPDLFHGVIALSGAYDSRFFFGDYMDANLYQNSIVDYMANISPEHPYIKQLNEKHICICTGQGAWEDEMVRTTTMVRNIFAAKGIKAWIDFWGYDVNHDWPWWQKQLPYFLKSMI